MPAAVVGAQERSGDEARSRTQLPGAGMGLSILDGLFRFDVARGIYPEKGWRTAVHIGARF